MFHNKKTEPKQKDGFGLLLILLAGIALLGGFRLFDMVDAMDSISKARHSNVHPLKEDKDDNRF